MTSPTNAQASIILHYGANALSAFRQSQLLRTLQGVCPDVTMVSARFTHWAKLQTPVQPSAQASSNQVLNGLLQYGDWAVPALDWPEHGAHYCCVVPRLGTISPWSTKATDIAHHAGLQHIERIERGISYAIAFKKSFLGQFKLPATDVLLALESCLVDRMTENVLPNGFDAACLFETRPGPAMKVFDLASGHDVLQQANIELGLALSDDEIEYLYAAYQALGRGPSDVELLMFAQANSEHCRHKIFNATWTIDGQNESHTLFGMIRHTHAQSPHGTILAYSDNAAILQGQKARRWFADADGIYREHCDDAHLVIKVETHNHPTAIAPFSGAATGAGGEIRDEGATGIGAKPKAGLSGFTTSHLRLNDEALEPWEENGIGFPGRIATPKHIMTDGPIGAAAFNNEFGRPNLGGYFRTFEQNVAGQHFGYHKPIMIAGGVGSILPAHTQKHDLPEGTLLIQLGGPGMRIGMGGGAASSMNAGSNTESLDFDSVQRSNPEMERRAQEVIDACCALGDKNPILSIHDVGAGGLSNAFPELAHACGRGAEFELSQVPVSESGLSPAEVWCNESQERYVLAIAPSSLHVLKAMCERERCPFAVVGRITELPQLRVLAPSSEQSTGAMPYQEPVDMPMEVLLGKPPRLHKTGTRKPELANASEANSSSHASDAFDGTTIELEDAIKRVLRFPAVAGKRFLINIADRTVGGLTARDQMVGPYQVPVADVAVTLDDFTGYSGQAMAMGERTPLAVTNAPASGRMAVAEAVLNLLAAPVPELQRVKLSANWMAACGDSVQDAALFDTVKAVAMDLCPKLGLGIPVGKDSLSMRTRWIDDESSSDTTETTKHKEVISPVSLIVSAFVSLPDVRGTLTPLLTPLLDVRAPSVLVLVDLSRGQMRMGGSCLAQVHNIDAGVTPDVDHPEDIVALSRAMQQLRAQGLVMAYHDKSDGGLLVALLEMAFASRLGLSCNLDLLTIDPHAADWGDFKIRPEQVGVQRNELTLKALFNEELGVVLQIPQDKLSQAMQVLRNEGLSQHAHVVAKPNDRDMFEIYRDAKCIYTAARSELQTLWDSVSHAICKQRDNPACADAEHELAQQVSQSMSQPVSAHTAGIVQSLSFDLNQTQVELASAPMLASGAKPRVAILREQGVNGHLEMAAAFGLAGFQAVDVHMSDLLNQRITLTDFQGLAACGGFSYGDVLGAGEGWAKTIRYNSQLVDAFAAFFAKPDVFALGVCNGCQMLSSLADLIPGADHWPRFVRNTSEQYEARLVNVRINPSASLFLQGMAGSVLPVVVAHGEGRAVWPKALANAEQGAEQSSVLQYVDAYGNPTQQYPLNPNGSPNACAGVTSTCGRFTIMMPHPERVFRRIQMSFTPQQDGEFSPWMQMFRNARNMLF